MGKHSPKGVLTHQELCVVGTDSKRAKSHRIEGGEYTTVAEPLRQDNPFKATVSVRVTYSIPPQGPGKAHLRSKLCHPDCQLQHAAQWRRWHQAPPNWTPNNVVSLRPRVSVHPERLPHSENCKCVPCCARRELALMGDRLKPWTPAPWEDVLTEAMRDPMDGKEIPRDRETGGL